MINGEITVIWARRTILASGGAGQLYRESTNPKIATADGHAMAYRAGATLQDMEMVQFHPTTLYPSGILLTEGIRGEGGHLLNSEGDRFMRKYAPNAMELASRDVVSRAEQTEIDEGRGFPDGTVALDITKVPRKRTLEALREIVNLGKDFAVISDNWRFLAYGVWITILLSAVSGFTSLAAGLVIPSGYDAAQYRTERLMIAARGRGVVFYLAQEGRGAGLAANQVGVPLRVFEDRYRALVHHHLIDIVDPVAAGGGASGLITVAPSATHCR